MARTQISEDFGKSSIFDHFVPAKVQSSMVQLGRKTTTTIDIGMLTPVDTIEVIPGILPICLRSNLSHIFWYSCPESKLSAQNSSVL